MQSLILVINDHLSLVQVAIYSNLGSLMQHHSRTKSDEFVLVGVVVYTFIMLHFNFFLVTKRLQILFEGGSNISYILHTRYVRTFYSYTVNRISE